MSASALESLTRREREVLDRMALGLSNTAIASELVLAQCTVEDKVASIFRRLGIQVDPAVNRRVLAVRARLLQES
jgi:DNA-binding NarL/FixJ family response regulator